MALSKQKREETIEVPQIKGERVRYHLLGTTPMIIKRMCKKGGQNALFPTETTRGKPPRGIKHDPVAEFRESPYTISDPGAPTFLAQPAACFKKATATAAVDIPGATKAQLNRLLWVDDEAVLTGIYGYPKILMSTVRNADMNRTPDMRTRCVIPRWAAIIDMTYVTPILREPAVSALLSAAGIIQGIGDWRPQKGGNNGKFTIVDPKNKEFQKIIKEGGRDAQIEGMERALPADDETAELLAWFFAEAERRGIKEVTR